MGQATKTPYSLNMGDMTTPAVITEAIADVTTKVVDLDATLMTSSRAKFLLAAIGAAVGFGNMWRFPAIAHGMCCG